MLFSVTLILFSELVKACIGGDYIEFCGYLCSFALHGIRQSVPKWILLSYDNKVLSVALKRPTAGIHTAKFSDVDEQRSQINTQSVCVDKYEALSFKQ